MVSFVWSNELKPGDIKGISNGKNKYIINKQKQKMINNQFIVADISLTASFWEKLFLIFKYSGRKNSLTLPLCKNLKNISIIIVEKKNNSIVFDVPKM